MQKAKVFWKKPNIKM